MGSERLSDDEIAAIAARCEKATAGPWRSTWDDPDHGVVGEFGEQCAVERVDPPATPLAGTVVGTLWHDGLNVVCREHDAAFIAHARTDVPRLLAECARLRAVEAAAISACELEGGPGEDAALEDLRAALRGGR